MLIDQRGLLVELARRGLTQVQLAQKLKIKPSTFSSWIREINPAPERFREDLEDALGLRRGALKPKSNSQAKRAQP